MFNVEYLCSGNICTQMVDSTIVEFEDQKMVIQLEFARDSAVSLAYDRDSIRISLLNEFFA